jgi:hypothetical protein
LNHSFATGSNYGGLVAMSLKANALCALFNPHAPADPAGEGFERLWRDSRPDLIKLTPARFVSARAAAEAAACPHRNRGS